MLPKLNIKGAGIDKIRTEIIREILLPLLRRRRRRTRFGRFLPIGPADIITRLGLAENIAFYSQLLVSHLHRGSAQGFVLGKPPDGGHLFPRLQIALLNGLPQLFIKLDIKRFCVFFIHCKKIQKHLISPHSVIGKWNGICYNGAVISRSFRTLFPALSHGIFPFGGYPDNLLKICRRL